MIISDLVKIEKKVFFLALGFPGLFMYDFNLEKGSMIAGFKGYKLLSDSPCTHIVRYNNSLFLAPGFGDTFYSYDFLKDELQEITFDGEYYSSREIGEKEKFSFGCQINGKIYFVGYNSLEIAEINPVTYEGRIIKLQSFERFNDFDISKLSIEGCVDGTTILIPLLDQSKIIKYDTLKENIDIEDIAIDYKTLGLFKYHESMFAYSLQNLKVSKIRDGGESVLMHIQIPEEIEIVPSLRNICHSVKLRNGLFLIPFRGNMILELDEKNDKLNGVCDVKDMEGERTFISSGAWDENTLWAYSEEKNELITFDERSGERQKEKISIDYSSVKKYFNLDSKDNCIFENYAFGLKEFLSLL